MKLRYLFVLLPALAAHALVSAEETDLALIEALLKREYSADDVQAIMGGNLMRVWREVEDHAKPQAEQKTG